MTRIQELPRDFDQLALVTVDVDPSELLRIAWAADETHVRFNRRARYRFDAPNGEYGVLYAAFDLTTAFVETVLRDNPRRSRAGGAVILDHSELVQRRVIQLTYGKDARPLRLVKLYDEGLAAAHTDNQIASRDHYPTTQRWSRAFHIHPIQADGIVYMSRYMGSTRSVVIFDRAKDHLARGSVTHLLEHADLPGILDQFQLGIDKPS